MTSSFTFRTPPSGDGTLTPLMVTLLSRGSVPRAWTYLPSPSSRSSETLGSRPTASAMFVLGRLVITSAGSTCTMLSAFISRLIASISPRSRSPGTMIRSFSVSMSSIASAFVTPEATVTSLENGLKPTYETLSVYLPAARSEIVNAPSVSVVTTYQLACTSTRAPTRASWLTSVTWPLMPPFRSCACEEKPSKRKMPRTLKMERYAFAIEEHPSVQDSDPESNHSQRAEANPAL